MRASSPSSNNWRPSRLRVNLGSLFIAIGTCALLMLVIVLITGGFVIDTGPLHFSARRWRGPLVVALIAWTSATKRRLDELKNGTPDSRESRTISRASA